MFIANIGGFIIMKYRYVQMEYFEFGSKITLFTLIIGQISLVTSVALFLFPNIRNTKYHITLALVFFISADLYWILNLCFVGKLFKELKHFINSSQDFNVNEISLKFKNNLDVVSIENENTTHSLDILPMIGFKYISQDASLSENNCNLFERVRVVVNTDNNQSQNNKIVARLMLKKCQYIFIIRAVLLWLIMTITFIQLASLLNNIFKILANLIPLYIQYKSKELNKYDFDVLIFIFIMLIRK